jgi:hypothetical protein
VGYKILSFDIFEGFVFFKIIDGIEYKIFENRELMKNFVVLIMIQNPMVQIAMFGKRMRIRVEMCYMFVEIK